MKTTVELPDALVNQIQRRAVLEGRDIKDVIVDLLKTSMPPVTTQSENGHAVAKELPPIKARSIQAVEFRSLTTQEWCDWIKGVDLNLDLERYEEASGHQHVDRPDA